jgi:hypothetical protein
MLGESVGLQFNSRRDMSKVKKTLLVVLALCAAAVFAIPASASAVEWKYEGEPLAEEKTIDLEGTLTREGMGYSFRCGYSAEATLFPGDEGEIRTIEFLPETCVEVGGGVYTAGCELKSSWAALPWRLHATKNEKGVISVAITNESPFEWPFMFNWQLSDCTYAGEYNWEWGHEQGLALYPLHEGGQIVSYSIKPPVYEGPYIPYGPGTIMHEGLVLEGLAIS